MGLKSKREWLWKLGAWLVGGALALGRLAAVGRGSVCFGVLRLGSVRDAPCLRGDFYL